MLRWTKCHRTVLRRRTNFYCLILLILPLLYLTYYNHEASVMPASGIPVVLERQTSSLSQGAAKLYTAPLQQESKTPAPQKVKQPHPVQSYIDNWIFNHTAFDYIPDDFRVRPELSSIYPFAAEIRAEGPGMTLITMFHMFTGQEVKGYELESKESLKARNWEYLSVLKRNTNHVLLKRIVLLYTHDQSMAILSRQNWPNITKIYPLKMNRMLHMTDFFTITSKHLINETVIGSNGDIVIGEGFDQINSTRLRETKTLFSLTRHGNNGTGSCDAKSMCLMKYLGSHDTHIFNLMEPISQKALDILDYPVNLQQAENAMIGVLTVELGFKVINPCPVLKTYHVHCSRIANRLDTRHNSVRKEPYKIDRHYFKLSKPVQTLLC